MQKWTYPAHLFCHMLSKWIYKELYFYSLKVANLLFKNLMEELSQFTVCNKPISPELCVYKFKWCKSLCCHQRTVEKLTCQHPLLSVIDSIQFMVENTFILQSSHHVLCCLCLFLNPWKPLSFVLHKFVSYYLLLIILFPQRWRWRWYYPNSSRPLTLNGYRSSPTSSSKKLQANQKMAPSTIWPWRINRLNEASMPDHILTFRW